MKFKVEIEVELIKGPQQDEDSVLDALAGSLGRQNAAPKPFRFTVGYTDDEKPIATYEIKSVD